MERFSNELPVIMRNTTATMDLIWKPIALVHPAGWGLDGPKQQFS